MLAKLNPVSLAKNLNNDQKVVVKRVALTVAVVACVFVVNDIVVKRTGVEAEITAPAE